MFSRIAVSFAVALLGVLAATAPAYADNPDREEIAVGTFLVALGLMLVLFIAYMVRHAFGLDRMPPPESIEQPTEAHH
jgi:hypothetical protein